MQKMLLRRKVVIYDQNLQPAPNVSKQAAVTVVLLSSIGGLWLVVMLTDDISKAA